MILKELTLSLKAVRTTLLQLRFIQGTDMGRWQLTALCRTAFEFKRLSKHYTRESHNNDQRSNRRHKVRDTGTMGEKVVRQELRREKEE